MILDLLAQRPDLLGNHLVLPAVLGVALQHGLDLKLQVEILIFQRRQLLFRGQLRQGDEQPGPRLAQVLDLLHPGPHPDNLLLDIGPGVVQGLQFSQDGPALFGERHDPGAFLEVQQLLLEPREVALHLLDLFGIKRTLGPVDIDGQMLLLILLGHPVHHLGGQLRVRRAVPDPDDLGVALGLDDQPGVQLLHRGLEGLAGAEFLAQTEALQAPPHPVQDAAQPAPNRPGHPFFLEGFQVVQMEVLDHPFQHRPAADNLHLGVEFLFGGQHPALDLALGHQQIGIGPAQDDHAALGLELRGPQPTHHQDGPQDGEANEEQQPPAAKQPVQEDASRCLYLHFISFRSLPP